MSANEATGKKRRHPGLRAPPSEQRPTDRAATTASYADEARNTQAPDRRGSTRPRSRQDRSRRTALGQRLQPLAARRPPHSLRLRRRWTRTASTRKRIGVSWVIPPSHESRQQVPRHSDGPVFPGTSGLAFIPDCVISTALRTHHPGANLILGDGLRMVESGEAQAASGAPEAGTRAGEVMRGSSAFLPSDGPSRWCGRGDSLPLDDGRERPGDSGGGHRKGGSGLELHQKLSSWRIVSLECDVGGRRSTSE